MHTESRLCFPLHWEGMSEQGKFSLRRGRSSWKGMLPAGVFVFQLLFVTLSALFRNSRLLEGEKKKRERREKEKESMRPSTECIVQILSSKQRLDPTRVYSALLSLQDVGRSKSPVLYQDWVLFHSDIVITHWIQVITFSPYYLIFWEYNLVSLNNFVWKHLILWW